MDMISYEHLFEIKNNPETAYPLKDVEGPMLYATPRTRKKVFDGCLLDLTVRAWNEKDRRKHFVLTFPPPDDRSDLPPFRLTVLKATITKPGNHAVIHYVRVDDNGKDIPPQVVMTGIFNATTREVRTMLNHAREIRPYVPPGKKPTAVYKDYIERWEQGESYERLLADWRKANPNKPPKLFYRAFYRQGYRKRKSTG